MTIIIFNPFVYGNTHLLPLVSWQQRTRNGRIITMKSPYKFLIFSSVLFLLWVFTVSYYLISFSRMSQNDCFSEPNFTKVMAYLENKISLRIDNFTLRIFEWKIVIEGWKWEMLGSISREQWVIPVVISGYGDMLDRMNGVFCTLVEQSNQ